MELLQINLNFVWVLMATILVIFMQVGFCLLEVGMIRSKNSINVAMKNVSDFMVGSLVFALIGFPLMFGLSESGWFGTSNFFFSGMGSDAWDWSFLLFQIAFAGTAATIVSGAIAERIKFSGYLLATIAITMVIYPVFGHWAWGSLWKGEGGGWLEALGFMDFAGSTVVHGVGAWIALAAILVIGARKGKYDADGNAIEIKGSNPILATIGMFLLWLGWFGFNAGSTTVGDGSIAIIALNTQLAAITGGIAAMCYSWKTKGYPKIGHILNGVLGGLVAITAGCNVVSPIGAILIGLIGGVVTMIAMEWIEKKLKVDDAVGAIAVHGFSGAWGTIALALFASPDALLASSRLAQLSVQALGVGVGFLWAFGTGYVLYAVLKKVDLLRVSEKEELEGLDFHEHGDRLEENRLQDEWRMEKEKIEATFLSMNISATTKKKTLPKPI